MAADLTFEEWVIYVFDNPPSYAWFDLLEDCGDCPPAVLVDYLTRTFEHSGEILAPFSNAQLGQSLWFLAGEGSAAMEALFDVRVPWPARRHCIRAMVSLFEQCFAKRCGPSLSHLSKSSGDPLGTICYMWWDLFPTWGQPREPSAAEIDAELLDVMRQILCLPSDACRESALHGMGHWAPGYPERVAALIDAFLAAHPGLRPELKQYASNARCGCVQ